MSYVRLLLACLGAVVGLIMALPLAVLGTPFWVVGGLTRLIHALARRILPQAASWRDLVSFDPVVGWKNVPNLDVYVEAGGLVHVTTDADGWRGHTSFRESDVVVFGDSFAFGHAADDREFFAARPTVRVKAVGSNGYNMVQALLWMERLSAELAGKFVVWFVYYGNDLYDNLQPNLNEYRMPFVRSLNGSTNWEIVTSHISPNPWPFAQERVYGKELADICSPTLSAERAWGACRFLVARGREICGNAGAGLAILGIPAKRQLSPKGRADLAAYTSQPAKCDPEMTDRKLGDICRELRVPFAALTEYLTLADYKTMETHWNARGHRLVADVIEKLHRDFRGPEARSAPSRYQI